MTSLAERVERAVEGSRELDAEIAEIALLPFCEEPDCLPDVLVRIISRVKAGGEDCEIPAYTTSIDAALTLVPEGHLMMVRHLWDGDKRCGYAFVSVYTSDAEEPDGKFHVADFTGLAATPALALAAAALKAREGRGG